jgi:hypothetical protein
VRASDWQNGTASIIILPGEPLNSQLLKLAQQWSSSWLLKPAFWVSAIDDVGIPAGEPARIKAKVVGRNGIGTVTDLMPYLSTLKLKRVTVVAARIITENNASDGIKETVEVISGYLEKSRPRDPGTTGGDTGILVNKVNLVFAPTEREGADYSSLHEPSWNMNLVVAPEDRFTPESFDGFIRYSDSAKLTGFILSNIAITAGIWAGQSKSIFEVDSDFSDKSPVFGQVKIMRSFVRGVISEGLSIRVAAEALRRTADAELSSLTAVRSFQNEYFDTYPQEEVPRVIDEMVEASFSFSNGALNYVPANFTPRNTEEETGVFAGIKLFLRSSWAVIKVLPLWYFKAISDRVAGFVQRRFFGSKGREKIKGEIDFPKTNLDKNADQMIDNLESRLQNISRVLANWPRNVMRRSEPKLWDSLRKIMIGKLDGSPLPEGVSKEPGSVGERVLGELNQALPAIHDRWELPETLQRTLDSEARSASWKDMDTLDDLNQFLNNTNELAQKEELEASETAEALAQEYEELKRENDELILKYQALRRGVSEIVEVEEEVAS